MSKQEQIVITLGRSIDEEQDRLRREGKAAAYRHCAERADEHMRAATRDRAYEEGQAYEMVRNWALMEAQKAEQG